MQAQEQKIILIEWEEGDKEDPRRMSNLRKAVVTLILSTCGLCVTGCSSVWSMVMDELMEEFNVSHEVAVLGVAMFTFAVAFGPLVGGPCAESFGKRPVFAISMIMFFAFQFATSFGSNIATMIVGRALTGLFGSVFLSVSPAAIGELYYPQHVGFALNFNSTFIFCGPVIGPTIGAFAALIGPRWPFHIFVIWSGVMLVLTVLFVPETYSPMLLKHKARRMRKQTNDGRYKAQMEVEDKSILASLQMTLQRPIKLFFLSPMMTLLCIYSGFLLSLNYFFSVVFPIVFKQVYNFSTQSVGLAFLGLSVGMFVGGCLEAIRQWRYGAQIANSEPENRLIQMCIGSVLVPIGLFIFAWTIYPSISHFVPIAGSFIFGVGSYWTFNCIINYTVSSFCYPASAVSANVFVRCIMGGILPLVGQQMVSGLGRHIAMTVMGIVGALLMPSAFLLYKYGGVIRSKSKFTNYS